MVADKSVYMELRSEFYAHVDEECLAGDMLQIYQLKKGPPLVRFPTKYI